MNSAFHGPSYRAYLGGDFDSIKVRNVVRNLLTGKNSYEKAEIVNILKKRKEGEIFATYVPLSLKERYLEKREEISTKSIFLKFRSLERKIDSTFNEQLWRNVPERVEVFSRKIPIINLKFYTLHYS